MRILPARPADAEAMARLQVAAWRETYPGILPDATLDRLSVAERTGLWRRVLEGGGWACLLRDGRAGAGALAGFVSGGPSRDDDAGPATGEIYGLYVLAAWQGRGLGRRLMAAAVERLGRGGFRELTLWALAENRLAARFYDGLGGRVDRTEVELEDGRRVREVRYRWKPLPAP